MSGCQVLQREATNYLCNKNIYSFKDGDNDCESNPCLNNGTCSEINGPGYLCACAHGFTGTNCEKGRQPAKYSFSRNAIFENKRYFYY